MQLDAQQTQGLAALRAQGQKAGLNRLEFAAYLATAWVESKFRPNAVGDNNTSFGLFEHHVGGAGGSTLASAQRYLDPNVSAADRAPRFAAADIDTGAEAAALQRPADRVGYASKVNTAIRNMLAGLAPDGTAAPTAGGAVAGTSSATGSATSSRPKWSPARDAVARKAAELGVRHNGGDRTPEHNAAVNGVDNSDHLTTNTKRWADDYAVSPELERYAKSLGLTTLVHNAGSGMHLHIAGDATSSSTSTVGFNPFAPGGNGDLSWGDVPGNLADSAGNAVRDATGISDLTNWLGENVLFITFAGLAVFIGGALIVGGSYTAVTGRSAAKDGVSVAVGAAKAAPK